MAQAITAQAYGNVLSPADMSREVADKTTTAAFTVLARGARWVSCLVYQKAFTSGTGTVPVQYIIEGASNTGFTTGVVTVGVGECERADEATVFIQGFSPLTALKFWRVRQVKSGTDAATFDAKLSANG